GPAPAQAPGLPPAPVPVSPAAPGAAPAAPPRTLPPGAVLGPPATTWVSPQAVPGRPPPGPPLRPPPPARPPVVAPFQDRNGPLPHGEPASGWFADVDIALLAPHVKNALAAPVTVPGLGTGIVHVGGGDLDWTGSPSIGVGYRLGEGCGAF